MLHPMPTVTMTCMTTKKQFEVDDPDVVVLKNGRYAYRAPCPWEGKNGKQLSAFKFCSSQAHADFVAKGEHGACPEEQESEHAPDLH